MSQDILASIPLVPYSMNSAPSVLVPNITRRPEFNRQILELGGQFLDYVVKDEETPELIAYKLYDSAQYYWIVLLFNDILDPLVDWPLSTNNLDAYVNEKYQYQTLIFPRTSFLTQIGSSWEWLTQGEIFMPGSTIQSQVGHIATVKCFDPTLGTLQLSSIDHPTTTFNENDLITFTDSLGVQFSVKVTRVVSAPYAVHHFESTLGKTLNPMRTSPEEVITGNITRWIQPDSVIDMTTNPITDTSIQNAYAIGNNSETYNAVTFLDYETRLNDAKRSIKLLRPEYLAAVAQQIGNLLKP